MLRKMETVKFYNSVWIIDDDEIARFIIRKNLENAEMAKEIKEFPDGLKAIELLKKQENYPDLILLDINMPLMSAWEFLEEIVELNKDILSRIYIVTSSINIIDKQRADRFKGLCGFIEKPFEVEKLTIGSPSH